MNEAASSYLDSWYKRRQRHEFEENSSDWLWETDAEGNLVRFPQAFDGLRNEETKINLVNYRKGSVLLTAHSNKAGIACMKFHFPHPTVKHTLSHQTLSSSRVYFYSLSSFLTINYLTKTNMGY